MDNESGALPSDRAAPAGAAEPVPVSGKASIPSAIECPKCEAQLYLDVRAAVGKDQCFSYRVYPSDEARMMQAKAIGGQLTAMDDLMRACAREDGGKVRTYIKEIVTHEDGSLEFFLAVLPVVIWDARKGKFVKHDPFAQGMETPRGGDAQQAPSHSDDSPVPQGCAPTTPGGSNE